MSGSVGWKASATLRSNHFLLARYCFEALRVGKSAPG